MIYDPKGVEFMGTEKPKVFHAQSEQGNRTQRYVYLPCKREMCCSRDTLDASWMDIEENVCFGTSHD